MTRDEAVEMADDPEMLFADGLDDALIGVTLAAPGRPALAVYDAEKCAEITGEEWFFHNTLGSWLGERTPLYVVLP